uniref:Uncharacterized protein LOC114333660 n=1 Tax=Diabrotica virgifera virgifera TaxID=50390 RepID=A0A6P7FX71_DIAVI
MICTKCINSAHNAYKFQQQCNKSQILLETYLQQIKNMEIKDKFETDNTLDLNEIAAIENTLEKECENVTDNGNLVSDGLIKEFIQDEYLPNDDLKDGEESEDCDDLKSCIPLGEDTVDQLIKDNFRVENLELISPKLNFCGLNLDEKHSKSIKNEKVSKEVPSMNYYKSFGEDGEEGVQQGFPLINKTETPCNRPHISKTIQMYAYTCSICNKSFTWNHSFKAHQLTHEKTDITKDDNNTNRTLSQINDNPLSSINENSALHTNESLLNRNDNSLVDFTAGSTYPNDNVPLNESFVIFTNSTEEVGNDAFQICTYAAGESDLLDTFTLYSSDTDQKITSGNS